MSEVVMEFFSEEHCTQELGHDLGTVFNKLLLRTYDLHWAWKNYYEIYGKDENIELLENSSTGYILYIRQDLGHGIISRISRLTDNEETLGKTNLTLQLLPNRIKDIEKRERVKDKLDKVLEYRSKYFKIWRNEHISHDDLCRAKSNSSKKPLPVIDRDVVKPALKVIIDLLGEVVDCKIDFEELPRVFGHDSKAMISTLKIGLAEKKRLQNVRE